MRIRIEYRLLGVMVRFSMSRDIVFAWVLLRIGEIESSGAFDLMPVTSSTGRTIIAGRRSASHWITYERKAAVA